MEVRILSGVFLSPLSRATVAAVHKLPALFKQPLNEGDTNSHVPDVERLLSEYYEARRYDRTSGKPSQRKLLRLGLDEVAAELYRGDSRTVQFSVLA